MRDGQKIVKSQEGDERPGVTPSDLVFILQQKPHSTFKRRGDDLIFEKHINLSESLTGCEFIVPGLGSAGKSVIVRSKPGVVIKPDHVARIKGKGMPLYHQMDKKGDLVIHYHVQFPSSIPDDLLGKLEKLLPQEKAKTPASAKAKASKGDSVTLEDPDLGVFHEHFGKHSEKRRAMYDSDEEEEGGLGGSNIECGQS